MPIFQMESQKDNFYVYPETYALILIFKNLGENGKKITCGTYKTNLFLFYLLMLLSYSCLLNCPPVIEVSDCIL